MPPRALTVLLVVLGVARLRMRHARMLWNAWCRYAHATALLRARVAPAFWRGFHRHMLEPWERRP
tara:strand:+ start:3452 stop:3646 length:195 start_codon:yes stop_codon:yes gene_type:complete